MQTELRLFQEVKREKVAVDSARLIHVSTLQGAYRLCLQFDQSKRDQEVIAELLHYKKGTFNTILNSDHNDRERHMPPTKVIDMENICGNTAVSQWLKLYGDGLLICQRSKKEQLADLERQAEQLRIDIQAS